jgi:hypothetical protein
MIYTAVLYIVFGQNPHLVVTVTKDGSMGLLIKLLLLLLLLLFRMGQGVL